MKRWIWAVLPAAVLTAAVTGIYRPRPLEARTAKAIMAIDFSKDIRGVAATVTVSNSTCAIPNSDGSVTHRITETRQMRLQGPLIPGGCDETPSTGGLDGVFEAELTGWEKHSDSGGDVPPRPVADQPEKDDRGVYKGEWRIRRGNAIVAKGQMLLVLHVNTHKFPAIPNAETQECYVPDQIEGMLDGTAVVADHRGCRVSATFSGHRFQVTPGGFSYILDAEGLVLCPCKPVGAAHG